jgi:hypothetical protein
MPAHQAAVADTLQVDKAVRVPAEQAVRATQAVAVAQ